MFTIAHCIGWVPLVVSSDDAFYFFFHFCLPELWGIADLNLVSILSAFHSSHNYEPANCKYSTSVCWLFHANVLAQLDFPSYTLICSFHALVQLSHWTPPEHLINISIGRLSSDTNQRFTVICFNRNMSIYGNKQIISWLRKATSIWAWLPLQ